ncbi:SDR family oxidoreductase [Williamsia sp.]|uniref:SDR family oxidoreductase n=1 Tax=Williamsia sp. TaxID=1872085 RepID=UPI0039C98365
MSAGSGLSSPDALEKAAESEVIAIGADLSTPEGCSKLAQDVLDRVESIDILVNNAGVTWGAPVDEFPSSAFDKVLDLEERRDAIEANTPFGRIGRPDDVIGAVLYLTSRAGSYLTGAVIPDGRNLDDAMTEM